MPTPRTCEFFFDPSCRGTWMTSRWLVEAAQQRDVAIVWRNLSLGVLNEGEVPEKHRAVMESASRLHRVIAALRSEDDNTAIADLYTEWGRRAHHDGEAPSDELVRAVVGATSAARQQDAADDASWDAAVAASTHEAVDLAGPDVGSPVLAFGEPRVGIFGPIVSPPPTGRAAGELFDHVIGAAAIPAFHELKRGRRSGPQFGPRP